jgi:hypothetical protein
MMPKKVLKIGELEWPGISRPICPSKDWALSMLIDLDEE